MDTMSIERRFALHTGSQGVKYDARTVECALKVQRSASTASAVEYLKSQGVEGTVIFRVLSNGGRREAGEDGNQYAISS